MCARAVGAISSSPRRFARDKIIRAYVGGRRANAHARVVFVWLAEVNGGEEGGLLPVRVRNEGMNGLASSVKGF